MATEENEAAIDFYRTAFSTDTDTLKFQWTLLESFRNRSVALFSITALIVGLAFRIDRLTALDRSVSPPFVYCIRMACMVLLVIAPVLGLIATWRFLLPLTTEWHVSGKGMIERYDTQSNCTNSEAETYRQTTMDMNRSLDCLQHQVEHRNRLIRWNLAALAASMFTIAMLAITIPSETSPPIDSEPVPIEGASETR